MSGMPHGFVVDRPFIQCLVSFELFCSIHCAVIRNKPWTLTAAEDDAMIMDAVSGMKAANYTQVILNNMVLPRCFVS